MGCFPQDASVISYIDCSTWSGWEAEASCQCGFLSVPENHEDLTGKKIKIAFAIKNSGSNNEIPTIILTGGPGGAALDNPRRLAYDDLQSIGDVILVDQRGMGYSDPLPNMSEETMNILAADLNQEQAQERMAKLMQETRTVLDQRGIQPDYYNTTQSAQDFGLLLQALGYKQYNLWGASYGTKLAAYIMKHSPSRIHAAALSGLARLDNMALYHRYPHFIQSLQGVFDRCNSDPSCQLIHGSLRSSLLKALELLDEHPVVLPMAGRDFTINPQDGLFLVRYMLYQSNALDLVSQFVKAVADNDVQGMRQSCSRALSVFSGVNISTFYSYNAYEEFSSNTESEIAAFVSRTDIYQPAMIGWFQSFIPALNDWHHSRVSLEESALGSIDIPTLLVSNTHDPVTPPENVDHFKRVMTRYTIVQADLFGHVSFNPCITDIRRSFLKEPTRTLSDDCLQQLGRR